MGRTIYLYQLFFHLISVGRQSYTHINLKLHKCVCLYMQISLHFSICVCVHIYTHTHKVENLCYGIYGYNYGLRVWPGYIGYAKTGTVSLKTVSTMGSHFDLLEQVKGKAQRDRMQMTQFNRLQFLVAVPVLTNLLEAICPMKENYIDIQRSTIVK